MPGPQMTLQTRRVLAVLLSNPLGRHYGLDVSRRLGLPTGSIYPILARLERSGWVSSDWEEVGATAAGGRARRYYRLTGAGAERTRRVLERTARSTVPRLGVAGHGEVPA
jgi:PadR family transcriptional regulator, regulatory protein PadR